jgi:hypothetical protein
MSLVPVEATNRRSPRHSLFFLFSHLAKYDRQPEGPDTENLAGADRCGWPKTRRHRRPRAPPRRALRPPRAAPPSLTPPRSATRARRPRRLQQRRAPSSTPPRPHRRPRPSRHAVPEPPRAVPEPLGKVRRTGRHRRPFVFFTRILGYHFRLELLEF